MAEADYVIVGAGSAGCILAHRLTEDPAVKVLLIEAGGSDKSILYKMPAGSFPLLRSGRGNWNFHTVAQRNLDGRKIYFPRGKVLGGSSSINAMVVARGNAEDYDAWERLGNEGWGFDDCLPYFKKIERFSGGDDGVRGRDGLIEVSAPSFEELRPLSHAWVSGSLEAGHGFNRDSNGPDASGVGLVQTNCVGGLRHSTSSQYLRPAMQRPNLEVVTDATVTRLLIERGRCVGVEVQQGRETKRFDAAVEVILSSGAIGSPQILQLSGVGDPDHLRPHGIAVTHELKGVGANLRDHLAVTVKQGMTKPLSMLGDLHPLGMLKGFANWLVYKRGAVAQSALQVWTIYKSSDALASPDIQSYIVPLLYSDHGRQVTMEHGFTVVSCPCRPKSTGYVRIASANPADEPLIDPNYLGDEADMDAMIAAIREVRRIIAQAPFDTLRGPELAPGPDLVSDADLGAYVRAQSQCFYHPVGTCKMGIDDMAVVDPELKVHGIDGLRVVDASIMPDLVTATTNFPVMMIAEKAADMIRSRTGVKSAARLAAVA
jgi:choline dehydrogenase